MRDRWTGAEPSGFLFTDIEGSTRLWESFPEAMARVQAHHDELLRAAIVTNGGELYRSAGDSLQAAFPGVVQAVQAAIDAQLALDAVAWELPEPLRVRMAIHSARAERTATDDFRSPQLSRLEAMLSLAHGGQILLTSAASDTVRGRLAHEAHLIDLGRWQLPGIGRSERIVQIAHAGLRSEFPPFDAPSLEGITDRTRTDRFVGRRSELDELRRLLNDPDIRLITLTGPGGIGKTRLAQEFARQLQADSALPVRFIELVGLLEPAQVLSTIAAAVHVSEVGNPRVIDAIVDTLHDRDMLLILDNFEHLLPAAEDVAALLSRLPKLHVLVTSRGPLRVRGEWQFPVEPLSVPPAPTPSWEELNVSESVELFSDRVLATNPGFALETRSATAVAEICRKLEGLPLAIELAAPLVRVLTMDELNERLDDRLGLVADEDAEPDGRHHAIRASIAWSYELLSSESQAFLRSLGVLQSGFTLETLDGLLGDQFDVLTQIELLVEQNLVRQGGFQRESDRFFLLESVRQFALEQLEDAGELLQMQQRHARYFSALLLDRYPDQRDFDAEAARQLRPVIDDLHQAILWTLAADPERTLALAAGAWRLWFITGQVQTAARWLELVLNRTEHLQTVDRVRAIYGRALVLYAKSTMETSIALSEQSLRLAESIGDYRGIGDACNYMAGAISESRGDLVRTGELIARALAAYERIDDRHGWAESLLNRASMHYENGRLDESLRDGQQVIDYCLAEGKDVLASNTIHGVAGIAFFGGRPKQTRALLIEGFELSRRLGYDVYLGANLSVLGMLLDSVGWYEDALRLSEFARAFTTESPGAGDVADPFHRNALERETALANLLPDAAERAMAEGSRLTPAEAVDQALDLLERLPV